MQNVYNNGHHGATALQVKYLSEATQRALADRNAGRRVTAQEAFQEEKLQKLARRAPTTTTLVLRPSKTPGDLPKPYPHHLA